MSQQLSPDEVTSAAERIVAAYSVMDEDAYFASFDPQATFIFHGTPERLTSREDYEGQWRVWVSDGWKVISCHSSDIRQHPKYPTPALPNRTPLGLPKDYRGVRGCPDHQNR